MPLEECYNQLRDILGQDNIEPFESVALVEQYRRYWKPDNVRIILLAESPLFTSNDDRNIPLLPNGRLPGYPTRYAKFVYCLAYGERQMTGHPLHPRRDGTPPFWKVFYSCNNYVANNTDFHPILRHTPDNPRLNNKIDLLLSLRDDEIWLVDSSIVALYHIRDGNIRQSAIRQSWECYTRSVIVQANPEHIICIGIGVANVLERDIRILGIPFTVIAQPGAHLSAEQHMLNFQRYGEICLNGRGPH